MLRFYRRLSWKIRDRCDFTQVEVTDTYPEAIRMREELERQEEPASAGFDASG